MTQTPIIVPGLPSPEGLNQGEAEKGFMGRIKSIGLEHLEWTLDQFMAIVIVIPVSFTLSCLYKLAWWVTERGHRAEHTIDGWMCRWQLHTSLRLFSEKGRKEILQAREGHIPERWLNRQ